MSALDKSSIFTSWAFSFISPFLHAAVSQSFMFHHFLIYVLLIIAFVLHNTLILNFTFPFTTINHFLFQILCSPHYIRPHITLYHFHLWYACNSAIFLYFRFNVRSDILQNDLKHSMKYSKLLQESSYTNQITLNWKSLSTFRFLK